ncbi:MAG: hypothetical protein M1824_001279 [Vezdaea acicularis]|nr:MAG: hypothetical protein M1824_001279 [Vezdaea acicularis]
MLQTITQSTAKTQSPSLEDDKEVKLRAETSPTSTIKWTTAMRRQLSDWVEAFPHPQWQDTFEWIAGWLGDTYGLEITPYDCLLEWNKMRVEREMRIERETRVEELVQDVRRWPNTSEIGRTIIVGLFVIIQIFIIAMFELLGGLDIQE